MKNFLKTISYIALLTICFFAVPVFSEAGVIPKAPNSLGLVGYWSLDDGVGTTATDFSGSGKPGTLTGGATWIAGRVDKGVAFNGTNAYMRVPSYVLPASGTISLWAKSNTTTWNESGFLASHRNDMIIHPLTGTKDIYLYTNSITEIGHFTVTQDITQWNHYTWVITGSQSIFYINGVAMSTISTATLWGAASGNLDFGQDLGSRFFNGSIDEMRVYSRAISASEIVSLYNASKSTKLKAANGTNLVGYWSFEDGTSTKATDFSGGGNTGTLTNMANDDWINGRVGKALDFDGSNDYVALTDSALSCQYTISAWIKGNSSVNDDVIVGFSFTSGGSSHYARNYIGATASGDLQAETADPSNASSKNQLLSTGAPIDDNMWHHVVLTLDGSYDARVYYDSVLKQTVTDQTSCSGDVWTNAYIGGGWSGSMTPARFFHGVVDDVRIYNTALTTSQISNIYNSSKLTKVNTSQQNKLTSGLVGYWSFDGKDIYWGNNTAFDRSGQGNNGTITNMSQTTAPIFGVNGQALSFNGTNNRIVASDTGYPTGASARTTSLWFNTTSSSGNIFQVMTWYGNSGSNNQALYFGLYNGNDCAGTNASTGGVLSLVAGTNGTGSNVCAVTAVNDGVWHHAVDIYDGSTHSLYLDGVLKSTRSQTMNTVLGGSFTIGSLNAGTFFTGNIDEVRFYNRALTVAEITQLYRLGR